MFQGKNILYNLNQIRDRPHAPPIVEDAVLKNFFCGWGGTFLINKCGWITSISPSSAMIITMVIMILVVMVRIIMMMIMMVNHQSIVTSASIDRTNYGEASDHLPINAVLQMWSSLPRKFQKWSILWGALVQTKDKNFKELWHSIAPGATWSDLCPVALAKIISLFITNMIFSVDGDTGKHQ